jgi:hypothetical protein
LNIACHGGQIDRQFFENSALVEVGGRPADQIAILCLNEQICELRADALLPGVRARTLGSVPK